MSLREFVEPAHCGARARTAVLVIQVLYSSGVGRLLDTANLAVQHERVTAGQTHCGDRRTLLQLDVHVCRCFGAIGGLMRTWSQL